MAIANHILKANFRTNTPVQFLFKSINIWKSYSKNTKGSRFFGTRCTGTVEQSTMASVMALNSLLCDDVPLRNCSLLGVIAPLPTPNRKSPKCQNRKLPVSQLLFINHCPGALLTNSGRQRCYIRTSWRSSRWSPITSQVAAQETGNSRKVIGRERKPLHLKSKTKRKKLVLKCGHLKLCILWANFILCTVYMYSVHVHKYWKFKGLLRLSCSLNI